ncbi:MAG TPA: hypothetical protein PKC28_11285 [Bdellovibrionales bacterium]|nr:hypothetical protein [Bdellovibrionales bacterium]
MKIWCHRYALKSRDGKRPARVGALLKIEWVMNQVGYSDLHPWPEFGEPELDAHLESVAKLQFTPLADISVEFNYLDRDFRLRNRNAFAGLILPRAHRLSFDWRDLDLPALSALQRQGFTHLKVKMGRDLKAESEFLVNMAYATTLMWRIDMNGRLSADEFTAWWQALDPAVRKRVDFVEDPIGEGRLKIGGPWARDWTDVSPALIRVLKPVREKLTELSSFNRVIFTHGLDHSFGQACALWTASRYYADHPKRLEVCGLASPGIYEADEFSRVWDCPGPRLKPPPGLGFGFDDVLGSVKWEQIL